MARRQKTFTPDTVQDIYAQLTDLREAVRLLNRTPSSIERINPRELPDAVESQVAIDSRTNCFIYYSNGFWRSKCSAVKNIKVYGDTKANVVREGAFRFTIEKDLEDTLIERVEVFNGTEGSGLTSCMIQNVTRGINILNSVQSVPSGVWHSIGDGDINDGGNPDDPNNLVHYKDRIWVNVTAVGAGSKGLGTYIEFHGMKVDLSF